MFCTWASAVEREGSEGLRTCQEIVILGPIFSSLLLENHFEPELLSEKSLQRIVGRLFGSLLLNA
jgi:hypothetical protein